MNIVVIKLLEKKINTSQKVRLIFVIRESNASLDEKYVLEDST